MIRDHKTPGIPSGSYDLRLCRVLQSALGLRFNLRAETFQFGGGGDTPAVDISESALFVLISTTLAQQPELFPPAQIRPRRLKRIINVLRALCADAGDDTHLSLEQFVERRLKSQPGADVTGAEIRCAYELAAVSNGNGLLSKYEFDRRLSGLIKRHYGLSKLHEIQRLTQDGRLTKRNGWRGLTLTDGTDTTDTTDAALPLTPSF
jgi:hypothetical protein